MYSIISPPLRGITLPSLMSVLLSHNFVRLSIFKSESADKIGAFGIEFLFPYCLMFSLSINAVLNTSEKLKPAFSPITFK